MTVERALEEGARAVADCLCEDASKVNGQDRAVAKVAAVAFLRSLAADPPAEVVEAARAPLLFPEPAARMIVSAALTRLAALVETQP